MTDHHKELVTKLEKLFGRFDLDHRRFEKANNSIISKELGYSDAQFSRLINNSATEGEYQRAIQNVDRILTVKQLESQIKRGSSNRSHKSLYIAIGSAIIFFLAFILTAIFSFSDYSTDSRAITDVPRDHTLKWAFESSFINPYIKLDDLPSDCNYPCYKYQGKWELENSYKLPFFRERNGFHYLATDVEMYGRCMVEKSDRGDIIEGYEYQKHEIWYDMREWPIDSFINGNTPKDHYQKLDFRDDGSFVKIANLHTFFRNEFNLQDSSIHRTGKVIGRDLELVPRDELRSQIKNEQKLDDIEIEISRIISNRLKDFSVPIKCNDSPLISKNLSDIKDGDRMSFRCQLTTSGFSIPYEKTYVLKDQYIKNNCFVETTD